MKYKIIVDKQSRLNPSPDRQEYEVDIEELRCKGDIADELIFTNTETYVMRRLALSEYQVLSVLPEPVKQTIENVNIKLFEGNNYIYLLDMAGNWLYVKYILKNDFTDVYVTLNTMQSAINQTAKEIALLVSQKLESYSTTEEIQSLLEILAYQINLEVSKKVNEDEFSTKLSVDWESVQIAWNKISEYIQFINAELQIKDSYKNLLMALTQNGQEFYNNGQYLGNIGTSYYKEDNSQKALAFNLNENGRYMGWFAKQKDTDTSYISKLYYAKSNSFGQAHEGIYLDTNFYLNNYPIVLGGKNQISEEDNMAYLQISKSFRIIYPETDGSNSILFQVERNKSTIGNTLDMCGFKIINNGSTSSDGRLKKNIYNSKISAIDRINQMKHREFKWKENDEQEEIGYIAQELEEIDNNYVSHNYEEDEDGNITIDRYEVRILPILATATKAIQEQQLLIEQQQEELNKQKQFIELVREKLNMQSEYDSIFTNRTVVRKANKKEQETIYEGEVVNSTLKVQKNREDTTHNNLVINAKGEIERLEAKANEKD